MSTTAIVYAKREPLTKQHSKFFRNLPDAAKVFAKYLVLDSDDNERNFLPRFSSLGKEQMEAVLKESEDFYDFCPASVKYVNKYLPDEDMTAQLNLVQKGDRLFTMDGDNIIDVTDGFRQVYSSGKSVGARKITRITGDTLETEEDGQKMYRLYLETRFYLYQKEKVSA